jgi:hypothetical protein
VLVNNRGEIGPMLGVRGRSFARNYLPHRGMKPTYGGTA